MCATALGLSHICAIRGHKSSIKSQGPDHANWLTNGVQDFRNSSLLYSKVPFHYGKCFKYVYILTELYIKNVPTAHWQHINARGLRVSLESVAMSQMAL